MSTAFASISNEEKKIYTEVVDKETGEETKVPVKIQKVTVNVTSRYGDSFSFSKTNRSQNFTDSRDKAKVTLDFVYKEILRIAGKEQADNAKKELQEV